MQYSPKLKKAMEEIKKVCSKYDIAASVVLHTPGFSEYLLKIDPSYSCARFEGDFLRVKAKLQEDFHGDKEAHKKVIADTSNMLNLLAEVGGRNSMNLFELSDRVDKTIKAQHTDGGHTGHTQQNN